MKSLTDRKQEYQDELARIYQQIDNLTLTAHRIEGAILLLDELAKEGGEQSSPLEVVKDLGVAPTQEEIKEAIEKDKTA
jgi:prefoldin subunit 5